MTPQPTQLKGSNTTVAGIISIIFGALGIFTQIWGGAHGQALDVNTTAVSAGTVATGIGLLVSADQNQKPKGGN